MSKNKSVNWAGLKQAASKVRMQATKEKSYFYAIKAPDILPGVVPKGRTAPVLAQDAVPYQQAAAMYSGGGFPGFQYLAMLASRSEFRAFASTLSTEMTREWIDFTSEQSDGSEDSDKIKAIKDEFDRLKVQEIMRRAVEHDCLYGRAQIFLDINNQDRSLPMILDKRTIKPNSLNSISTVEAVWTTPASYNAIDPAAPDFYKPPKWFMLGQEVHSSRLMTVVTREMPDILKPAFNFAGISLSQLAEPYVDNWLRTRQSVSDLINIFSLTVLKTDMSQVLQSADDGGSLFDRADLFTALRSNKGLMLLDKEREDVMQLNTPLSGLDKLQAQSQEQMCSVSKIPAVVLTGISPTGLNASSEGEIKGFRDWIAAQQNSFWRLPLETILKVVQLNLFGEIDPTIGIKFNPLDQMTPKEQAEIRFSDMQTDTGYIDHAVIDAQEVRKKLADDPDSVYQGIDAELEIVPPMNDFDPIQSAEDKSVSEAQHKAMEAAAHGKSTLGIPKKVGEEFVAKDSAFKEEDHPRDNEGKFSEIKGVKKIEPTSEFSPEDIIPRHEVRDQEKVESLKKSMSENGFQGNPILAYKDASGSLFALTGVHRLEAARDLGIDVPLKIIDDLSEKSDDYGDFISDQNSDEDILEFLKSIKENDSDDISQEDLDDGISLIEQEIENNNKEV